MAPGDRFLNESRRDLSGRSFPQFLPLTAFSRYTGIFITVFNNVFNPYQLRFLEGREVGVRRYNFLKSVYGFRLRSPPFPLPLRRYIFRRNPLIRHHDRISSNSTCFYNSEKKKLNVGNKMAPQSGRIELKLKKCEI